MQRTDRTNRMYIHPVRQPHWPLLTNHTRSSTLNPNTMSRNLKLKATERRRILPSRVHGARLNPNRAASYLQEPNPKPIRDKQIAEEGAKSTKKQRENSGEGWASAGICGGIQRAHLSIDSRRIGSDLGFAALREKPQRGEGNQGMLRASPNVRLQVACNCHVGQVLGQRRWDPPAARGACKGRSLSAVRSER